MIKNPGIHIGLGRVVGVLFHDWIEAEEFEWDGLCFYIIFICVYTFVPVDSGMVITNLLGFYNYY